MGMIERSETGWRVVSASGKILRDGMTNAQAWRFLDVLEDEPVSASQVASQMKEPEAKPTQDQLQDFFSGLLQIEADRDYKKGWAWHRFCEKFGHTPDGLHRTPCKPSKQVWGWMNRKAIARHKK